MNNAIYVVRDKVSNHSIDEIINKYSLSLCYNYKNEKILKNEKIILFLKKKYAFLRVLQEDNMVLIIEIKKMLN